MTPERHARVKEIFLQAIERAAHERDAFLQDACGADPELRAEVDALLRLHHDADPDPRTPETLSADVVEGTGSTLLIADSRRAEPEHARPRRAFEAGTMVGQRYRIVAPLGAGGMGVVYRAEDLQLGQTVALKFLPPELARDPAWLLRLNQEVRVAREVTHPNVCRVYDISASAGDHFISMEYIDGEDLKSLLKRIGRLPQPKALDIARQLCAGLAAAHAKGVLHRDLKPANVMLDGRGQVRLTDFGLAGVRDQIHGLELFAGTPAYMAPEQLTGQDVSVRSDLYALGLVLYELFTGRPAFRAETRAAYVHQHQSVHPSTPTSLVPELDPVIERVILRCLAKDPRERPASALAVAAALPGGDVLAAALAAGETPSPEMVAAAGERSSMRASLAGALLAGFLLLLVGSVLILERSDLRAYPQLDKRPSVLAEKARSLALDLGLEPAPVDEAHGFTFDLRSDFLRAAGTPDAPRSRHYDTDSDAGALFWYRGSPASLLPQDVWNVAFDGGRVTPHDPPPVVPDMVTVMLSPSGRLLGFEWVPELNVVTIPPAAVPDWTRSLSAAGLDPATLVPTDPIAQPRVFADQQWAWRGVRTDPRAQPVRVEAAACRGVPVCFVVLRDEVVGPPPLPLMDVDLRRTARNVGENMLLLVLAIIAIPLARLNLLRGRGDLRGAYRLAAVIFAASVAVWLLESRHSWGASECRALLLALVVTLGEATLVWLFYVALEPYVRRFWPQTIISWSRLLAGRLRDPLIGRNLLIGAVLGAYWVMLGPLDRWVASSAGLPVRAPLHDAEALISLMGGRATLAVALAALARGLYLGLALLLLMVLLRMLLRSPWVTALATLLVIWPLYMPFGAHPLTSWFVFGLLGVGLGAWAMMRFGLVTVVALLFVSRLMNQMPVTFDAGAWYFEVSLFALALAVGLALLGFALARLEATAREPAFSPTA